MGSYGVLYFFARLVPCVGLSHHKLSFMRQGSHWPCSLLNTSSQVPCPQCLVQCLTQNLGLEMFTGCTRKAVTPPIQLNLLVISSAPRKQITEHMGESKTYCPVGTALYSPFSRKAMFSRAATFLYMP